MKPLMTLPIAAIILFAHLTVAAQRGSAEPFQNASTVNSSKDQTGGQDYKLSVHSDLVFLPTRVQNRKGETIYGLKPKQFVVEDNGVRQSAHVEEDPDSPGLSLVVAVQCSRFAPSEFTKLKGLGAMIEGLVGDAPHEVSIISFGEGPYVLGDFSSSPDAVTLALSKLKPCGDFHAATIDTVYYAISRLKRRKNHYRRAILLISETRDHGSRSKLHEVVAELGVTDTVIYSVAFSASRDEVIRDLRYGAIEPPQPVFTPPPAPLHPDVESNSSTPPAQGPIYLDHTPLLKLPVPLMMAINSLSLQRISNEIHNYYLLSFKPASTSAFGFHSLQVRVPDYPDAAVQTRRSYWSGIPESPSIGVQSPK